MNELEIQEKINKIGFKKVEIYLQNKMKKNPNNNYKYLLGYCYSKQYNKKELAITTFKDLLRKDYKTPYMYLFLSETSFNQSEKMKIIEEGLLLFPNEIDLKKQKLFTLSDTSKENYYKEIIKDISESEDIIIEMASYYYNNKQYKECLDFLKKCKKQDPKEIDFLMILVSYLSNTKIKKEDISHYLIMDDNTILGTIIKLIEICIEKNLKEKEILLKELNYCKEYELFFLSLLDKETYHTTCFPIDSVFYEILKELYMDETLIEYKNKLRIIVLYPNLFWMESKNQNKEQLKKCIPIIKQELSIQYDANLHYILTEIYRALNDNKNLFKESIVAIEHRDDYYYINYDEFSLKEIEYIVEFAKKNIKINRINHNQYQRLIEELISDLFNRKKYSLILELIDKIDYKKLNYLEFGFEIAYTLKTDNRVSESKKIYEEYLKENPKSSAAHNNLGVIYEENDNNYKKALSLYKKAEQIEHNEIYENNIIRCEELLKKQKEEIEHQEEDVFISQLEELSMNITKDKLIEINYNKIINTLKKIKVKKVKEISIRDYKELVLNYIMNQQKVVLLLCGSIIELLLYYVLNNHNIHSYIIGPQKNKRTIEEMDLSQLLEVCKNEKLLPKTPDGFVEGIKQFRNFIHPGKEIREQKTKLNKSTIDLCFNLTNWLILNIDL